MNARLCGVFHGLMTAVDIFEVGACQTANHRVFGILGNLAHSGEITLRSDWKTRLNDVDAHIIEQARNLELFFMGHGRARRLLSVAQSCVKNYYAVLCHRLGPI